MSVLESVGVHSVGLKLNIYNFCWQRWWPSKEGDEKDKKNESRFPHAKESRRSDYASQHGIIHSSPQSIRKVEQRAYSITNTKQAPPRLFVGRNAPFSPILVRFSAPSATSGTLREIIALLACLTRHIEESTRRRPRAFTWSGGQRSLLRPTQDELTRRANEQDPRMRYLNIIRVLPQRRSFIIKLIIRIQKHNVDQLFDRFWKKIWTNISPLI
jgi:hypothetical protein